MYWKRWMTRGLVSCAFNAKMLPNSNTNLNKNTLKFGSKKTTKENSLNNSRTRKNTKQTDHGLDEI